MDGICLVRPAGSVRRHSWLELLPILRFNAGLDLLYLVVAGFLLSRKKPLLRGFGLGVFVQGAFLLLFDGYFWWRRRVRRWGESIALSQRHNKAGHPLDPVEHQGRRRTERLAWAPAMNPTDFLILIVTWVLACCWVVAHGLTVNGIGPAALLLVGGTWNFWMQWLRHRSWLRHRDSGFAPGTQHLALLGGIGFLLCVSSATVWVILIARQR